MSCNVDDPLKADGLKDGRRDANDLLGVKELSPNKVRGEYVGAVKINFKKLIILQIKQNFVKTYIVSDQFETV